MNYDANGGKGALTDDLSPYLVGSKVTVGSNTFTKAGYKFVGWNTLADGTGTDYSKGDIFEISSNITFYAIFEEV